MNRSEAGESGRYLATRQTALVGALVNIALAVVKIVFGLLAHSQSLVADGVHSVSDLLTDALVYYAARHAREAPDARHPYGHDRFETAATLALGIVLILVGLGIGIDAAERLFHPDELLHPGVLALYVAAGSILGKELLYQYTMRVAQRVRSAMLRANAWHHRSDAISSIVVFVGIGGTLLGLPYLDAIAAVAVGLMIGRIGWDLGWGAMQELVDAGLTEDRLEAIRKTILSVGGVRAVHMLRTRKMGEHAVADVHVIVEPWLSVSEGHMISDSVALKLVDEIEELNDVTVHIDPEDDEKSAPSRGLPLRTNVERLLNELWQGLDCVGRRERMILHYLNGRIDVEVFFPLHCCRGQEQARALERAMRARLEGQPWVGKVRVFYG